MRQWGCLRISRRVLELAGLFQKSSPFVSAAQREETYPGTRNELVFSLDRNHGSGSLAKPLVSPRCLTHLCNLWLLHRGADVAGRVSIET